jgi:CBS domain-containing protein
MPILSRGSIMQISDILNNKLGSAPREVVTGIESDTVNSALKLMTEHNIGAIVIVREQEVVGVYSERDVVKNCQAQGIGFRDNTLGDMMSSNVIKVQPQQSVDEALALMRDHKIRHLPVVDEDNHMVGFLSLRDLIMAKLDYADKKAEFLKDQIHVLNSPLPM